MINKTGELWRVTQFCRNARISARIRVNEMAALTGYSTGTIERFERGENNNLVLYLAYVRLCAEKGVTINVHEKNAARATDIESPDR